MRSEIVGVRGSLKAIATCQEGVLRGVAPDSFCVDGSVFVSCCVVNVACRVVYSAACGVVCFGEMLVGFNPFAGAEWSHTSSVSSILSVV